MLRYSPVRYFRTTIVCTLFDRDAFMDLMMDPRKWYYAHRDLKKVA